MGFYIIPSQDVDEMARPPEKVARFTDQPCTIFALIFKFETMTISLINIQVKTAHAIAVDCKDNFIFFQYINIRNS